MKALFFAIEINLLLWLAAVGMSLHGDGSIWILLLIGAGFAAIVQHWAYYALYKQKAVSS